MKGYFDLWFLAANFDFDGRTLADAIDAIFSRRDTDLPTSSPIGLTAAFASDAAKQAQ